MPPKRMTANPVRPARYRPGKAVAPEESSSEEEEEEEKEEGEDGKTQKAAPKSSRPVAAPKATSFPTVKGQEEKPAQIINEDEFETESEGEEGSGSSRTTRSGEDEGPGSESEESSEGDEDSSSDESAARQRGPLVRPTFIKKDKRQNGQADGVKGTEDENARYQKEEEERQRAADELVEEQLRKDAAERAAGNTAWDDEDQIDINDIDDTDGLDPEAESAAWKLRELKRVKRDREAIEVAEKEREEVERRRNLTAEEREAEDAEYIEKQKNDRDDGRGKMGYMQKYFHKGAFFQDDLKSQGLDQRDLMGTQYQDDVSNRELLPQYMQIRDMTRLGRKGRTKYKDLKSEDTGRWGDFGKPRGERGGDFDQFQDERFKPERDRPRQKGRERAREDTTGRGDRYRPSRRYSSEDDGRHAHERRDERSSGYRPSRSKSPRRRDYDRDDRNRRKRSLSADLDRDKRRKTGVR